MARAEIVDDAHACQWGPDLDVCWGGRSASELADELRLRPTRRLLLCAGDPAADRADGPPGALDPEGPLPDLLAPFFMDGGAGSSGGGGNVGVDSVGIFRMVIIVVGGITHLSL